VALESDPPGLDTTPPLRFGVLALGTLWPRWQVEALQALIDSGDGVIDAMIVDPDWKNPKRDGDQLDVLPFRVWGALMVKPRVRAWELVDASPLLRDAEVIEVRTQRRGRWTDVLLPEDVERVRALGLDALVRFGFAILRGPILKAARYGIWSYHHDDERVYRGSPPAFWAQYQGDSTPGVTLQRLTSRLDGGIVLRRGHVLSAPTYAQTLDRIFGLGTPWLAAEARRIRCGDTSLVDGEPSSSDAPVYHPPGAATMGKFVARQIGRRLSEQLSRATSHDRWMIATAPVGPREFFALDDEEPTCFAPPAEWTRASSDARYFADPFVEEGPTGRRVLFEDYDYRRGFGLIGAIDLDDSGRLIGSPVEVYRHRKHLSYPSVFVHEGQHYCIPESAASGRQLVLVREGSTYREASGFDLPCLIDPTLFHHEGRVWLLGSQVSRANWELLGYYADDLKGPWVAHPLNPLFAHPRGARCGGPVFRLDDRLFRPAQDGTASYGGALVLREILLLTPTAFHEVERKRVLPQPDGPAPHGLHHVAFSRGLAVFDGKSSGLSHRTLELRTRNWVQRRFRTSDR